MSIIEKLEDLHKQATTERSHYYVASCCREAIAEIKRLHSGIDCAANALTDSILCSGNDAPTNMHFVRKLRSLSSPNTKISRDGA